LFNKMENITRGDKKQSDLAERKKRAQGGQETKGKIAGRCTENFIHKIEVPGKGGKDVASG